jgi:hypothetical protein
MHFLQVVDNITPTKQNQFNWKVFYILRHQCTSTFHTARSGSPIICCPNLKMAYVTNSASLES